ncbi:MAG: aminotransferase class I/II-fold pyridoxal phosphate-dependent enzyme [Oscillospiraceae bacterium]|nr:aminotransferase class I/II-fold pyridoxal phosphate-dependent enzyme [Oscillospiraceae bacterium]
MNYTHGGNAFEYGTEILDFSTNVNPLGTPDAVKAAAAAAIRNIDKYPDYKCTELRKAISAREGVPEDWIICGNGAAELIYTAMYAIKPDEAIVHDPTFSEYAAAVRAAGGNVSDSDGDVEFICNPNNPTGLLTPKEAIKEALKSGRTVFADECFIEFVMNAKDYSCVDWMKEYKNLVILKSFTKMYAMPGLRLGYLMTSDKELINKMYLSRQPWSVSSIAQAAGIAAAKDTNTPEFMRSYIRSARAALESGFDRLGIEYLPSAANFIIFKSEPGLKEKLLKHRILIRDCSDFKGISGRFYRVAVRTGGDNRRLLKALEAVLWQNQ